MEDHATVKLIALDRAIACNSGVSYDEEGKPIIDTNKIIEAAKKFETYLKGTTND